MVHRYVEERDWFRTECKITLYASGEPRYAFTDTGSVRITKRWDQTTCKNCLRTRKPKEPK